jgi:signal transduction histidine kinase
VPALALPLQHQTVQRESPAAGLDMTRLSTFIANNTEQILDEWEAFARSLPLGETMNVADLRDHAKEMLGVIQQDLELPQSKREQSEKSQGKSDALGGAANAAQRHGTGRAGTGYSAAEMVAEFRALRASVIRLWAESAQKASKDDLEDLTRFNEAIDQAIAESIERFMHEIDHSKDMFLAILGHDLRTPLGAVMMAADFMLDLGELPEPRHKLARQIATSARRMNKMIGDLLDFTKGRFGEGIPIKRGDVDLAAVARAVVAEVSASYPQRKVELETEGDLRGKWDRDRIGQALTNLLGNAIQHGAPESPVTVRAVGHPDEIELSVHNVGSAIPQNEINRIFGAMTQAPSGERDRRHLGLGLYIVERIVTSHGGEVDVRSSSETGTTFVIRLPRAPRRNPRAAAAERDVTATAVPKTGIAARDDQISETETAESERASSPRPTTSPPR